MDSHFFRVEHELLRSDAFKALSGSAIKVYLVIGLYSDFGSGWAFPSVRTIARQAGVSRQTVITAVEDLCRLGMLATRKVKGRSTAYRIVRNAFEAAPAAAPSRRKTAADKGLPSAEAPAAAAFADDPSTTGPESLDPSGATGPIFYEPIGATGPNSRGAPAPGEGHPGPGIGPTGQAGGPERETDSEIQEPSAPIPGTAARVSLDGRLVAAEADALEWLGREGVKERTAKRMVQVYAMHDVLKVLLNVRHLKDAGRLENGPGYVQAGLKNRYELLPKVAERVESIRAELERRARQTAERRRKEREAMAKAEEEAMMERVLGALRPEFLRELVDRAVGELPEPVIQRNPTLSNPFVRAKVYELAGGRPIR